ncbi:MAG: ribonuclease P protein component 1 [Candidatus Parvarchaeota archaeon]|nr:ribonuclease P protein component 1 [Candidatus Jingweiarchaeum tengchongense]MCW1297796.1 ribonuclease P protein component 1 [Candidatus Jingweiarchaeum tengchongense]MCW1299806.1 ribonuclease P protein component 1 [Candidatus Jingweiarchaeum tengchongense]MCW1304223.1 ribonuclease P protein component 1 [Candidatus Jingweiarchaeum tengchongense]MCW1305251.1 ribonuclease P protein component 1 [Candidatus Jingweiarchaeum tengchongense]
MISPKNITRHELIGLKVKVKKSINNSYEKIVGKVVDETKNMLVIEQMGREKMVPKKDTIFEFEIEGRKIRIDGNLLIGRPEDRLKR